MQTIIALNHNGWMRPGALNRERELSNHQPVPHMPESASRLCEERGKTLAEVYPRLSEPARAILLHPHIFPVMLGLKDAYIAYHNEPLVDQLSDEVRRFPEVNEHFGIFFNGAFMVHCPALKWRIGREGDFLARAGGLNAEQVGRFRNSEIDQGWVDLLSDLLRDNASNTPERRALHGFLMGYDLRDIDYAERLFAHDRLGDATIAIEYFGNRLLTDENPAAFCLLKAWESAMRYGYSLLAHFPDFWETLDVGLANVHSFGI